MSTYTASSTLPFQVIACPHCERPCRFLKRRWGLENWALYTDFAQVARGSADPPAVAKCPNCRACFWRHEALTLGYLNLVGLGRTHTMFGVDSVPPTDSPYATDLERAIVNGLPRSRSEIWRLHLMAWHRLNDGLRFEPLENPTSPAMDKPIRGYVAAALLKDMPNRRPLTRILRIDVLRQIGKFAQARKSAETMIAGLGVVKSLGEWESNRRNEIYRIFLNGQLTLTERGDRLPRPIELTQCQRNVWYETRKEADQCSGTDERFAPGWKPRCISGDESNASAGLAIIADVAEELTKISLTTVGRSVGTAVGLSDSTS